MVIDPSFRKIPFPVRMNPIDNQKTRNTEEPVQLSPDSSRKIILEVSSGSETLVTIELLAYCVLG